MRFKVTNIAAIALITFAALALGAVSTASAASVESSAGITVLESLQVSETSSVDFGYVHRPSEGQNTLTLHHADDSVTTDGDGDAQYVAGSSSSGLYLIEGAPERGIQMSVDIQDFDDPGLTLEEAHIDGSTDEASGYLDSSGQHSAGVGGVLTIDADAEVTTHTTDVEVTVDYE